MKVEVEQQGVIVGSLGMISIFTTMVVPDFRICIFPQPFHEEYPVIDIQGHIPWKIFVVIGEGDKAVCFVQ